eukprot:4278126-Amphidinium_carterae.1
MERQPDAAPRADDQTTSPCIVAMADFEEGHMLAKGLEGGYAMAWKENGDLRLLVTIGLAQGGMLTRQHNLNEWPVKPAGALL